METVMNLVRRRFLQIAGAAATASAAPSAWAQTATGGPKANQVMRRDLEGQGQKVQETVVTLVEFPPGAVAPWHMHPGAQELLYGLEGKLTVEVEGQGVTAINAGEAGLIAGDVPHTARNESGNALARVVVIHSRSDKDKPLRVDIKRS
jgi:quercetin dioxygenase-like cupin family protein